MKIAVAKYPIGNPPLRISTISPANRRGGWTRRARPAPQIAVLPEYLSLELGATFARPSVAICMPRWRRSRRIAGLAGAVRATGARARLRIVAGTFLLDGGSGGYRNRAICFRPKAAMPGRTNCSSPDSRKRPA